MCFIPNISQENSIFKGNIFDELLSRGNFISTQAILVRKKIIEKYLFDPNMPRLQDYDLILRMIPQVNISYTKDALVELHIQNDSLTSSSKKLKEAIYKLLKKQYNFNSHQKESFKNYLHFLLQRHFNIT